MDALPGVAHGACASGRCGSSCVRFSKIADAELELQLSGMLGEVLVVKQVLAACGGKSLTSAQAEKIYELSNMARTATSVTGPHRLAMGRRKSPTIRQHPGWLNIVEYHRWDRLMLYRTKCATYNYALTLLRVLVLGCVSFISVQSHGIWSEPISISKSPDYWAGNPRVLADAFGVHVFWEQNVANQELAGRSDGNGGDTIYYSVWDGETWSNPADILVAPSGGMVQLGGIATTLDREIAMVWSGDEQLFYSTAWPSDARNTNAWTTESLYVGKVAWPDLVIDGMGTSHIIWADDGTILYTRKALGAVA